MKRIVFYTLLFCLITINILGQSERKFIREGNKNYTQKEYKEASDNYYKAQKELEKSNKTDSQTVSKFNNNLGAVNYRNNEFNSSINKYNEIIANTSNKKEQAETYYNIGNSYLQSGDYQKSIESYKNALRIDPKHDPSRYNMAVATKAQQQQQSGGGGQNQQQNQDQQQQQNQQDQQDKQNKDKENQQTQQQEQKMSKEEMERFLESLQEKDKEVQEKVKKEQVKTSKRQVEKNW